MQQNLKKYLNKNYTADRDMNLELYIGDAIWTVTINYACDYMSHVMRKPSLCHMQTTKIQISLRIHAV